MIPSNIATDSAVRGYIALRSSLTQFGLFLAAQFVITSAHFFYAPVILSPDLQKPPFWAFWLLIVHLTGKVE
jgi:hypothetical protein